MERTEQIEQSEIITETSVIELESNLKVDQIIKLREISVPSEDDADSREIKELRYEIDLRTSFEEDLILHWGLSYKNKSGWIAPPKELYPENTKPFDAKAVQTKFSDEEEGKERSIKIKFTITEENPIVSLNFVVNIPGKNKWFNNSNRDYSLKFKALKKNNLKNKNGQIIPEFIDEIIKSEMEHGSVTLMHRYNRCYDILNSIELNSNDTLMWVLIWLRYSYIRVLDWQRNFNTKPRELAHSMSRLTSDIAAKYCLLASANKENPKFELSSDLILRMCLSMLGKGTGDGQKIRDEILVILHKHHIKETNDHFYEQWHQKLHNNTTPDDIVICEALIAYLKAGGEIKVYWQHLNSKGVTKERLANFERKIVNEPFYKPELIGDLESFLHILKAVHSSDDLVLMFNGAKYCFQGNDYSQIDEIIKNKDHWDTLKQIFRIADGRETLSKTIMGNLKDTSKVRDLVFFDICLETYLRQSVEKIIHLNLDFEQYVNEITAITRNLNFSYKFKEIRLILEDWLNIAETLKSDVSKKTNSAVVSALKIKSVSDRMARTLAHIIDYYNTNYDFKARYLGAAFNAEKYVTELFTEEAVRGSIFFTLSMILKKIEPILRKTANLGSWLIISRGKTIEPGKEVVKGKVSFVKSLLDVQFKSFEKNTILLCEQVGGNEEIPPGVNSLIIVNSKDYPDILSHVSVRARNLGVPFMVCFEDSLSESLMKKDKSNLGLKISGQNVEIIENISWTTSKEENEKAEETTKIQSVSIPEGFPDIIISMSQFTKSYVGAKSNNTKKIFGNLPSWVKYPESMAIPFNVCEYFLEMNENSEIKQKLECLMKQLETVNDSKISAILADCKKLLMNLNFVENEETNKLKTTLKTFGVKDSEFKGAWKAIKSVWCSKYNERAYISTRKVGINLVDIRMAILVQKIIPADYAFVIHTKNPSTDDENELYAEVVLGMGETLVGTYEGQSFAFSYNKKTDQCKIHSFPNKSTILKNKGIIFRSDSNTEDLEGFAGAGLFDSIPITDHEELHLSYHSNDIFKNEKFISTMMNKISQMGIEVENIYNYPQDIEGVIYNNEYYIVQTRPQV